METKFRVKTLKGQSRLINSSDLVIVPDLRNDLILRFPKNVTIYRPLVESLDETHKNSKG